MDSVLNPGWASRGRARAAGEWLKMTLGPKKLIGVSNNVGVCKLLLRAAE